MFIVPIGQLVEEKYGSGKLLVMMLVTTGVAGVLHAIFFSTGLRGASGIAFLVVVLSSFGNLQKKEIPITFFLILLLFFTKEIINIFTPDNISHFGHIIGGICGAIFGFLVRGKAQNEKWSGQKF